MTMMKIKHTILLSALALCCLMSKSIAQSTTDPVREFRAVWIATINNIDYPKRPVPIKVAHEEQYKNLLDKLKSWGFNAVIVQIRPAADAFYPSEYAPWSKFLTGREGMPPTPEYDPLEFMIEEAHKRSMEFHAWLNPFRATSNADTFSLASSHIFNKHRNWVVKYGNRYYLNPGLESVRQHLVQATMEVVSNYDIDAIQFDDYFYPYKIQGEEFPDSTAFEKYGAGFRDIADWRRKNVDDFIEMLSNSIKTTKPHVKFGISPFGVWRNRSNDRRGSNTNASVTTYDDLYADVLKWLRQGWIDYVIPQLYWNIGFEPADHETLVKWWSSNVSNQHLYIGHGLYKVGNNFEVAWDDPEEIPNQIKLNRKNYYTLGSAHFSANSLMRNRLGVRDSIDYYYKSPAVIPVMEELSGRRPGEPIFSRIGKKRGYPKLIWRPGKEDQKAGKAPTYYVIYRFKSDRTGDFDQGKAILTITPFHEEKNKYKFVDRTADPNEFYTYVVTAMNRLHYESEKSEALTIFKTENGLSKVK